MLIAHFEQLAVRADAKLSAPMLYDVDRDAHGEHLGRQNEHLALCRNHRTGVKNPANRVTERGSHPNRLAQGSTGVRRNGLLFQDRDLMAVVWFLQTSEESSLRKI